MINERLFKYGPSPKELMKLKGFKDDTEEVGRDFHVGTIPIPNHFTFYCAHVLVRFSWLCATLSASVIKLDKAYAMTYYFVMKYPLNQRISHSNQGMHSGTRLVMWRVVFTNQAQKDAKKLSDGGLRSKAEKLIEILRKNPYQTPPTFEKPLGDLSGAFFRRINIQHRLVYQILDDEKLVKDNLTVLDQGPMNPEELNRMRKIGDVLPRNFF